MLFFLNSNIVIYNTHTQTDTSMYIYIISRTMFNFAAANLYTFFKTNVCDEHLNILPVTIFAFPINILHF